MALEEVLLAAADKGHAHVLDATTGSTLRVLKDCRPAGGGGGTQGLCAGSTFVLTAERGRSFVHAWGWRKEQPRYRCQTPEKVACIAATADGMHCVAGGASGKLYLWQVATGALLLAWDAHFKAATALAFALSDGFLVSAGDDAIVLVWNLAELLHAARARTPPPAPYRTWTEHVLPVSALCVASLGQHDLIASASEDQTMRLWRIGDSARGCLHVADLPSALTCLAIHPHHSKIYAGAANGRLYQVPLLEGMGPAGPATGTAAAAMAAASCHTLAVRSVVASVDGLRIFSCAAEPGIRVWDAARLSLLQVLQPTLVVDALVLLPPPAALGAAEGADQLLLGPLKKFALAAPEAAFEANRQAMGVVPCAPCAPPAGAAADAGAEASARTWLDAVADLPLFNELAGEAAAAGWAADGGWGCGSLGGGSAGDGSGDAVAAEATVRQLRAQLARLQKLNGELYEMAADATLGPAAQLAPGGTA